MNVAESSPHKCNISLHNNSTSRSKFRRVMQQVEDGTQNGQLAQFWGKVHETFNGNKSLPSVEWGKSELVLLS